jgi:hypothetical protein
MNNTIFDLVEADLPDGKEGYFEAANRAPQPKDDSFINTMKDYGKTILKGGIEGVSRLGRMMGPLQDNQGKSTEEQLQKQTEFLEKNLPTDEGFAQKAIRRGLKEIPTLVGLPGGSAGQTAIRGAVGGLAGETAKELGAPEWAQSIAEISAFLGPDITKKLIESGSKKEIVQAGRKLGLSDEAITPLIQGDFKQKWLSKLAPRRGSTQAALENTKSELKNVYGKLQESPTSSKALSMPSSEKLIQNIDDILLKMPSSVRKKIGKDYQDLLNKPMTGESLINFYTDINHELGKKTKQLSLLKDPIKNALKEVSPEIHENFETINKLYSKYFPIAKRLAPDLKSDIIGASQNIAILTSLITGYYPTLIGFGGKIAGGKIAQQLLINPRFQQISSKIADAVSKNKFSSVKKLTDILSKEINKISPEVSEKLDQISDEELKELFFSRKEKDQKT